MRLISQDAYYRSDGAKVRQWGGDDQGERTFSGSNSAASGRGGLLGGGSRPTSYVLLCHPR